MPQLCVVIFAYSREQLLQDCIDSVVGAKGSQYWKKVLVYQEGHNEVFKVVEKNRQNFDLVLLTKAQYSTSLANINQNRILGTSLCFNLFQADLLLGIEEDTKISFDALNFIEFSYNKYRKNPFFRGVNLGSIEEKTSENLNTYSLIRFALHGQAGAITRKTWKRMDFSSLLRNMDLEGWDSYVEFIIKSGFMVTPNASRSLDSGWGGTHAPANPNHPHYIAMKRSFVDQSIKVEENYSLHKQFHRWREDAIPFRYLHAIPFLIRSTRLGVPLMKIWKKLKLPRI
jgi:hypothetical protein